MNLSHFCIRMAEGKAPDARVIIIGNTQVGKTTLINRFIDKTYTPTTTSTVTPVLSPTQVKTKNGEPVYIQLWDTAGQERYQSVGKVFYRGANFAVICYDCSDKNPLPAIENWKQNIIQIEPGCSIFLAGTKFDLVSPSQQLEVIQNGETLKSQIGALGFFATSALTGDGIELLFQSVADNWFNQIKNKHVKGNDASLKPKQEGSGSCCK